LLSRKDGTVRSPDDYFVAGISKVRLASKESQVL
jgi:hypothetical protein